MHTCASSIGPLDGNLVLRALKHSATQLPRGRDTAPRIRINKLPDLYTVPDPRAAFPKACAPEGSIRPRVASNVATRRRVAVLHPLRPPHAHRKLYRAFHVKNSRPAKWSPFSKVSVKFPRVFFFHAIPTRAHCRGTEDC